MKRINEIFYSLQGEGVKSGTPAVFIRFAGCNLKCPFCDTNHHRGYDMSDEEIITEASRYNAPLIVLTGGEPSLQVDYNFVEKLKQTSNAVIAIETNGTNEIPDNIDWVTLSPKTGISGDTDKPVVITRADEIKVVDMNQELEQYLTMPCKSENTVMLLQPCYVADAKLAEANIQSTVHRVLDNPGWRLSLQIHRILNIR